jgi:hypothetical protein
VNTAFASSTTLFAGTSNEVLVSTDSGATWNDRIQGLRATFVSGMASEGSTVLASDDHESDYTRGLYYSTNSGSSWARLNAAFLDLWSGAVPLAVHNGLFYVQIGGAVKFTEDLGSSWKDVGSAPGSINALVFRSADLFAASANGIFKSTDGGITWSPNKLPSTVSVISFCDDGTRLVASTASGLYISTDGDIWTLNTIWIGAKSLTPTSGGVCALCSNNWVFTTDFSATTTGSTVSGTIWSVVSSGSDLFAATGDNGLQSSSDNGATWTKMSGLPTDLVWSLSAVPNGLLVGTRDGGLWLIPQT